MRKTIPIPRSFLVAAAVFLPAAIGACATHRYYDSDDRVYHRWNHDEVVFYQRWEVETHRPHVDFDRRSDDDRRAYWHWRHDHRDDHREPARRSRLIASSPGARTPPRQYVCRHALRG